METVPQTEKRMGQLHVKVNNDVVNSGKRRIVLLPLLSNFIVSLHNFTYPNVGFPSR